MNSGQENTADHEIPREHEETVKILENTREHRTSTDNTSKYEQKTREKPLKCKKQEKQEHTNNQE